MEWTNERTKETCIYFKASFIVVDIVDSNAIISLFSAWMHNFNWFQRNWAEKIVHAMHFSCVQYQTINPLTSEWFFLTLKFNPNQQKIYELIPAFVGDWGLFVWEKYAHTRVCTANKEIAHSSLHWRWLNSFTVFPFTSLRGSCFAISKHFIIELYKWQISIVIYWVRQLKSRNLFKRLESYCKKEKCKKWF